MEVSSEESGDGVLCLGGPVFLMAPDDGVILTEDGIVGRDDGCD